MSGKAKVLLAAGGTGGHMFPAGALAEQLKDADYEVHLATDKRGMAYVSNLTPMELHQIPAATPYSGGLMALPMRIITLVVSLLASIILVIRLRPKVIIGFGGYPSFPPLLTAALLRIPIMVHEQNAYLGRANRMLAHRAGHLALSWQQTANRKAINKLICRSI